VPFEGNLAASIRKVHFSLSRKAALMMSVDDRGKRKKERSGIVGMRGGLFFQYRRKREKLVYHRRRPFNLRHGKKEGCRNARKRCFEIRRKRKRGQLLCGGSSIHLTAQGKM